MKAISVIIPLYNRATLIKETLNSVMSELHPEVKLQIIVVDDGSDDGGDILVEQYFPKVILIKQNNAGAPAARNRGLSEATGEYILFLDSDDLIEPNFFKDKIAVLELNPTAAAAYGPWEQFNLNAKNTKQIIPRHTPYPLIQVPNYHDHLQNLLNGWYIACHAILWRRNVLIELNGFDTSLPINQDVDLLFRLLSQRKKIIGVQTSLALYRDHEDVNRTGSISSNEKKLHSILETRKMFVTVLKRNNLLNEENKKSLSEFCFNYWGRYRKSYPEIAERFYTLSIELDANFTLKGGALYQFIAKLVGKRNAVIIKSFIT